MYNLVDEADGDSDYGSDYDSSNDDAEDVFERIAKYWLHYIHWRNITFIMHMCIGNLYILLSEVF